MGGKIRGGVSRGVGVGSASLALLLISASMLCGQTKPIADPSKASGSVLPVDRDFRFEVASIRPGDPTGRVSGPFEPSYSPGRFRSLSESIASLALKAFNAKHPYEMEYPEWMARTFFNIDATLPEGAGKPDLPIMIRHLLEDRFGLVFHREVRQVRGYELVVARSGPKLDRSPQRDAIASQRSALEFKNGVPQFTRDSGSGQLMIRTTAIWRGRNKTMSKLTADLATYLDGPVIDATGLDGEYDYILTFTVERRFGRKVVLSPPPPPDPTVSAPSIDPSLEHPLLPEALVEELGLRLRPVKNVPINVVVLDYARKMPTEN